MNNKRNFLSFDYLNPDFQTINGNGHMEFYMQPEQQFFFVHKIIDCLNKINESINGAFNFRTVAISDTALRDYQYFKVNIKMPESEGQMHLNYDKNNNFVGANMILNRAYRNKNRFPDHWHRFTLTVKFNENMQFNSYTLTRGLEKNDEYYLDILYDFDKDNVKLKDVLSISIENKKGDFDVLKVKKFNIGNTDSFDNFFNTIIDTVILSPNTFLEITPAFSIKTINSSENLEVFYDELRDLYEKGIFDIKDNLEVIKMAAI